MTLLPHTLSSHILVPLKRGFESFDDLPSIEKRSAKLIDLLYKPIAHDETLERYFLMRRLFSYATAQGERNFSMPCLHRFFMPTLEGMIWLKNRFLHKNSIDIKLISSTSGFCGLIESFKSVQSPSVEAFIIHDREDFNMHVTPCLLVKNSHGLFLYQLDSIAQESLIFSDEFFLASLPEGAVYLKSCEARQVDGFSCRIEAFILLKSLVNLFRSNPEMVPHDVFHQIVDHPKNSLVKSGTLQGAFLKTSQRIVERPRALDIVFGTKVTLEDMQKMFYIGCLKHIEKMGLPIKSEFYQGSVYLQCKGLKYVTELKSDLEGKKSPSFEFTLEADF